jgi:nucleotide-binding universal stress UspA family protein
VEVTSMHVIEGRLLGLNPYSTQNIGRQMLFEAVKGVKTVSVTGRLEFGSPSDKLIDTARKEECDLIVVGN